MLNIANDLFRKVLYILDTGELYEIRQIRVWTCWVIIWKMIKDAKTKNKLPLNTCPFPSIH